MTAAAPDIREQLVAGHDPRVDVTPQLAADLPALRAAVEAAGDGALVTAFGVLETLPAYAGLVEALVGAAQAARATVVLDVPDHGVAEAAPAEGPVFTAGAIAELRALLPAGHVVLHEVPLRGSAIVPAEGEPAERALQVTLGPGRAARVLLAFGPAAATLGAVAAVAQADPAAELARLRALESDAALVKTLLDQRPA